MDDSEFDARVRAVRRFNRFYTQKIGVVGRYLKSPFSLAEVRVLYELAHRDGLTATQLGRELGLDLGYLSRILRGFERRHLITREPSESDGRQSFVSLTAEGRHAFAPLDARSRDEIGELLAPLDESAQARLVEAMHTVEALLGASSELPAPYILRPHQPGDMGWVIHRHGVLYAQEYGWDEQFEALVAEIAAKFIQHFDPKRERCWIAERDGEIVGSVFVVRESDEVARLRLMLVEPSARGLGLGSRLVQECIGFAKRAGYRKMTLWTNSVLLAARRIYERAGFRVVREELHHSFGHDLVGETWDLDL
ncbi:MAG TPA: helix-turn-helix domain-containing GNAT family N-acetyltransferase [bacterium]|nr:helix-turn-helix domain-containing GNAT family N-acetyltransferase [bacterium]